ncbi:MAG: riboflavin synthase [Chitinophagaceae bacterium]|nr:riboflavin synthase [Chitinophagaceae bacterium]
MFTGIIECLGKIESVLENGTNRSFIISSPISAELKADQSVSHDGVCLTVEKIEGDKHTVTAIEETLKKTNLTSWQEGYRVNLERCLQMNDRLDGHIVQGHADTTAICTRVTEKNGSWEFVFEFDPRFAALIIEKGSVALNGISLTAFNVREKSFSVAIIPYTYHHTSIQNVTANKKVNIEFDVFGKYVQRIIQVNQK